MNTSHHDATALRLYGAEISYFSAKVRAYLRWKGLPFEEVSANRTVYQQIIIPRIGFPVIPVVHTPDGDWLQDSTDIIDTLEARHPEPSIRPPGAVQQLVARLLELLGDEWLLLPAMHYRWHHNRDWAMQAFGALAMPEAGQAEQRSVGERLAGPFAQAAELLGAEPAMHAAVEQAYLGLLQELNTHFTQHPFVLGEHASRGRLWSLRPPVRPPLPRSRQRRTHETRGPSRGSLDRASGRGPHPAIGRMAGR